MQGSRRAFAGGRHYDIGNDLYEAMLDKRMVYTCAYWRDADDLLDRDGSRRQNSFPQILSRA